VAVIAPSQTVLDSLGRTGRRPVERSLIPDPLPARSPAAASGSRSGDGDLEVVMVGRVARWKGQDVFLRAFAAAFPDGGARATLVGAALFGGDDERFAEELDALVEELALGDRLRRLGARDDVERWLDEAHVVVHASRSPEPFGQVIVEGMAAGAAVVATAGGGPSELVRDGVDGLLVPADDVDALARALQQLASDPDLRRRLGESGRRRAAELTDPDTVGAAVAAVHERAAARRR
jgi:glycosyltransferase involved in cell wall biosynthesis